MLPYSETKHKGELSIPRDRIREGQGFCPLANQEIFNQYVKNFKPLVKKAIGKLHTNDRVNMQAMVELVSDASGSAQTSAEKQSAEDLLNYWNNTVSYSF